jgi:hypothetical protein
VRPLEAEFRVGVGGKGKGKGKGKGIVYDAEHPDYEAWDEPPLLRG